jgi:hypothetical protein
MQLEAEPPIESGHSMASTMVLMVVLASKLAPNPDADFSRPPAGSEFEQWPRHMIVPLAGAIRAALWPPCGLSGL